MFAEDGLKPTRFCLSQAGTEVLILSRLDVMPHAGSMADPKLGA